MSAQKRVLIFMTAQVALVGVLIALAALLSGMAAVLIWLNSGDWPEWSAAHFGYLPPTTDYPKLDLLIDHLYLTHLGVFALPAGIALTFVAYKLLQGLTASR